MNYFWILNKSKIGKIHQAEDYRLDLPKVEGLFSKMTRERIWATLVCLIRDGRLGFDGGERRERRRPRTVVAMATHHGRWRAAHRSVGKRGLWVQTDHRGHRDDAGKKASSPWNKSRSRSGPRGVRTMADGEELADAHGFAPRDHHS
jgi:hypothetical protein